MIFKNNRTYDILKWIVLTGAPALILLISGLGQLYGFNANLITGTISLVAGFIGALIGVSANKYQKEKEHQNDA